MMNQRSITPSIDEALDLLHRSLLPYSLKAKSLDAGEEFQITVISANNKEQIELVLSREQLLDHNARKAIETRIRSELAGEA